MIIGLTGRNCAGKGEAANYLQKSSFIYYSLSDILREDLVKAGLPETRENLIAFGKKLREEKGLGVLALQVLEKIDPDKNYVIDSIRHPEEVLALKKNKDFFLIAVHANADLRFERIQKRGRQGDVKTLEEFVAVEKKEASSSHSAGQQLDETIKMADVIVENNHSLDDFFEQIKKTIGAVAKKKQRPSWDEYFLDIARAIAMRSNCVKRKVAALIIKDKRIISTGYNGTPRGVKNCSDGGCPRCNNLAEGGTKLDECLCSHAEENAITQAAYHGVAIKGSTIYTTFSPCLMCTKMIINSGIAEVVYQTEYPLNEVSENLLKEAGVSIRKFSPR
jgi:dCMP deaminase